jgi:hypothetical protein
MQRTERKGAAEEERGEDVVDIDFRARRRRRDLLLPARQ